MEISPRVFRRYQGSLVPASRVLRSPFFFYFHRGLSSKRIASSRVIFNYKIRCEGSSSDYESISDLLIGQMHQKCTKTITYDVFNSSYGMFVKLENQDFLFCKNISITITYDYGTI